MIHNVLHNINIAFTNLKNLPHMRRVMELTQSLAP